LELRPATARARANIALVKYWGKADASRNLPATGSISMTLDGLQTVTRVAFDPGLERDELSLDGGEASEALRARAGRFMELVRQMAALDLFARIESNNNFPTAAGLASSASGFAALACAATRAAGLDLPGPVLTRLAQRGSGSAPRSLLGGFVELRRNGFSDEPECIVEQLAPAGDWQLRLVIAVCEATAKKVGSTEGMERSRLTSPFYECWLQTHERDLKIARRAIAAKDFTGLAEVVESSCFKMHAVALSSRPALLYWNPASLAVMRRVWALREDGLPAYLTIDAGPNVKVLSPAVHAPQIASALERIDGVGRVIVERPGPGVEYLS